MSQPVANLLINGKNPSTISTTATTIKYFPAVPGASIGAVAVAPVAGFIAVPGSSRANGQSLNLRACGNIIEGADSSSPTVTFTLGVLNGTLIQNAKLTDIKSALAVAASTAGEFSTAGTPFRLLVDFNADSASGLMQGTYSLQIDGLAASTGQLSTQSSVNMDADQPLAFCLGVTFSQDGTHTNVANLYQFDIQQ